MGTALDLAFRIARVRPVLGDPLVADLPKLVRARLPLPADEEEYEEKGEGNPADGEGEPDGHMR
jgi:hypothetical protein